MSLTGFAATRDFGDIGRLTVLREPRIETRPWPATDAADDLANQRFALPELRWMGVSELLGTATLLGGLGWPSVEVSTEPGQAHLAVAAVLPYRPRAALLTTSGWTMGPSACMGDPRLVPPVRNRHSSSASRSSQAGRPSRKTAAAPLAVYR